MRSIELELKFDEKEEADTMLGTLQNATGYVGRKHGEWILFLTCPQDRILYLGTEIHYAVN